MIPSAPQRWLLPGALIAICIAGAIVRIDLLDQPMRYDEAVTYLAYVRPATSPMSIMRDYSANNHILHTLLVYFSTRMFGDAEWSIRLAALLAGIATIPAAFFAFRARAGAAEDDVAALWAAALVAGSGPLVFYSANSRGYALLALLALMALVAARRTLRTNSWRSWSVLAIATSLGFWTIPVMAYPCATIFTWLALEGLVSPEVTSRRRFVARFATCAFATVAMTAILYVPTIQSAGISAIAQNKWVQSHGVARFFRDVRPAPSEISRAWTMGIPRALNWLLHTAAIVSLLLPARHRGYRVPLLAIAIVASAAVLAITLRVPPTRVWLWLLPLYLGGVAVTVAALLQRLPASHRYIGILIALAIAIALCIRIGTSRTLRESRDTGTLRCAPAIVELLKQHLRPTDRVVATLPGDGILGYYLMRAGYSPQLLSTVAPRRLFIVLTEENRGDGVTTPRQVLYRCGVNPDQFHPPELLQSFPEAQLFAAARRRAPSTTQ